MLEPRLRAKVTSQEQQPRVKVRVTWSKARAGLGPGRRMAGAGAIPAVGKYFE